jgi:hypothetical protein
VSGSLLGLLDHKQPAVRSAAAFALGELNRGRGTDAKDILDALGERLGDRSTEVVVSACVALGRIGPHEAAVTSLLKLCKSRKAGLRAAALGALAGAATDARVLDAARQAASDDKVSAVRAAAVAVLAKIRSRAGVEALIAALERNPEGRLKSEILDALESFTGARPGEDHTAWNAWWDAVKDGFELPSADASAEALAGTRSEAPSYYGSEVTSKRVAFVVDASRSMNEPMKKGQKLTRMDVCKEQLRKVIQGLPEDARFNILLFGVGVRRWAGGIVRAKAAQKAKAIEFVNAITLEGQTNVYDGLETALLDPNVDTIYLLSDGQPTTGKFVARADILREVSKLNATRQIAIHTISVGTKSRLLADLARQNGGESSVH